MKNHWLCGRSSHLLLLIFVFILPLTYAMPGLSQTTASAENEGVLMKNPGAELWRNVRQRDSASVGISQVRSVDSGVLINPHADRWARFRVNYLIEYGLMTLVAIASLILLFYLARGKVRIEGGLCGKMVHRFNDYERISHWVLAIVFLFLAVTGLTLLLGRPLLIPLLGHKVFSILASASKESHNLFGPVFLVSLVMMLVAFVKRNIYARGDLTWLLKGGGMIGKTHVSGGFFNMGEKSWYWLVILVGLVISVSGLILVTPNLGQGRVVMELSHVVHVVAAIVLIGFSFGHIYLATAGTEGTGEGMKSGYVDIKWAQAHHDRWAAECHQQDLVISAEDYAKLQGKTNSTRDASSSADMQEAK